MALVSFTFFWATLDDRTNAKAEFVELLADGLHRGQLLVRVPLAFGELLAKLASRETTIELGGLERGIGLEILRHEIANILKEMRQMELTGLAPASGEVVQACDARV
jgi:hypothetical protein